MNRLIGSRIGKTVHNEDKEFNRTFDGEVIEEIPLIEKDDQTGQPRYTKSLEVIKWDIHHTRRNQQEFRFTYWDRTKFERRPLILSPKLLQKMLNKALVKGILSIKGNKIRVHTIHVSKIGKSKVSL